MTPPASAPTEHRLTLADGGAILVEKSPGLPLVLSVAEKRKGFSAVDLDAEEIAMLLRMIREAAG